MKALKAILTVLFLAIWLPAHNHCYLEMADLIPSDECCTPIESAPVKGDPCDTGCKLVEKAGYKSETYQKVHILFPLLVSLKKDFTKPRSNTVSIRIEFWPPETLRLSQFTITTALPIRAPSFVS